jgi:ABC-type transport system involved in cytochrome c biogenesis permease subunit
MGLVAHYFALLERSRGLHTVPYHDLYGSMSLFGWLLAVTYLGLELYHRQRSVGAFVLPFILVFFLAAHLAPADRLPPPALHGAVFAFHVTLSILAYAAFALSFVLSIIFLGEERLLRRHELGNMVWRLPPLELLERMSRSSVLVGLVAITIGTALGFISVDRLTGQYWFYDPKYIVTLLVLLLYVLYFGLARTAAWRGSRASKLCVFNFAVVVLSFTVVNLYLSHSHRYF